MSNRLAFALIGAVAVAGTGAATLAGCDAVLGIDRPKFVVDAGPAADPLTCDHYCDVMAQNCQGPDNEYLLSPDGGNDVCKFVCERFLTGLDGGDYPFFLPDGAIGEEPPSENSLGCRLWHAHAARALGPPDVHCRHAGPLGAGSCGGVTSHVTAQPSDFAAFCGLDSTFCTLPNDDTFDNAIPVYDGGATACEATLSAALNADASFYVASPGRDLNDEAGAPFDYSNTLNCRIWHLETAILQTIQDGLPFSSPSTCCAAVHCPHTGFPSLNSDGTSGPCN